MPISDDSHKKYPVLYLLHGHGDDQTGWIRKSMLELKVRDRELIVVMPTAHRGFYINGKHGYRYFDYLAKELPRAVGNFFHGSLERKDNYIAGLSMGGYGAFILPCPARNNMRGRRRCRPRLRRALSWMWAARCFPFRISGKISLTASDVRSRRTAQNTI